MPVLCEA